MALLVIWVWEDTSVTSLFQNKCLRLWYIFHPKPRAPNSVLFSFPGAGMMSRTNASCVHLEVGVSRWLLVSVHGTFSPLSALLSETTSRSPFALTVLGVERWEGNPTHPCYEPYGVYARDRVLLVQSTSSYNRLLIRTCSVSPLLHEESVRFPHTLMCVRFSEMCESSRVRQFSSQCPLDTWMTSSTNEYAARLIWSAVWPNLFQCGNQFNKNSCFIRFWDSRMPT
jgi:hypothetical protein